MTDRFTSEYWELAQGERYVREWLPASEPVCSLAFIHGLGDHGGRFAAPANWLVSKGVAVYTFDQLGHGKSGGRRVCIPAYEALLDDVESFLTEIRKRQPRCKLGLFGQSMGGNLALNYALRKRPPVDFLVAGSPMLRSDNAPGPILDLFARSLMAIAPDFCIRAPVNADHLAHDVAVQREFLDDPLVARKVSLRLGAALIDSGKWALEHASKLPYPVLIMHGDKDKITSHTASQEFAERSLGKAKLKLWGGGRHDLHLDLDREAYFDHMWNWIRCRLEFNDTRE